MRNAEKMKWNVPETKCTRSFQGVTGIDRVKNEEVSRRTGTGGHRPTGGRGASASACADLTNQLQCCWVDPACAWKKY